MAAEKGKGVVREEPSKFANGSQSNQPLNKTTTCRRSFSKGEWTAEEDAILCEAVRLYKAENWKKIAECCVGRTEVQCLNRWQMVLDPEIVRGTWSKKEDEKIIELVNKHGARRWLTISQGLLGRNANQCRERWTNHLKPSINRDSWTQEEEITLIIAHRMYGNKWTELTKYFPGRTDYAIKNHWNGSLKKKVDSYQASGLLDPFEGFIHVENPTRCAASSVMSIQNIKERLLKMSADIEVSSDLTRGSSLVRHSQSDGQVTNTELLVKGLRPGEDAARIIPETQIGDAIPRMVVEQNFLGQIGRFDIHCNGPQSKELPNAPSQETVQRPPNMKEIMPCVDFCDGYDVNSANGNGDKYSETCLYHDFSRESPIATSNGPLLDYHPGSVVCPSNFDYGETGSIIDPCSNSLLPFASSGKRGVLHSHNLITPVPPLNICPNDGNRMYRSDDFEIGGILESPDLVSSNFSFITDSTCSLIPPADSFHKISLCAAQGQENKTPKSTNVTTSGFCPPGIIGSFFSSAENPHAMTEKSPDLGALFSEPPSSGDFWQATSMNNSIPYKPWDSPTHDDDLFAIVKSAAKDSTPSVIKKRQRELLSPFQERNDKKYVTDINGGLFCAASTYNEHSLADNLFDENASHECLSCFMEGDGSSGHPIKSSETSAEERENLDNAFSDRKDEIISMDDDKTYAREFKIRNPLEMLEHYENDYSALIKIDSDETKGEPAGVNPEPDVSDLLLFSDDCKGYLTKMQMGIAAETCENQICKSKETRWNQGACCGTYLNPSILLSSIVGEDGQKDCETPAKTVHSSPSLEPSHDTLDKFLSPTYLGLEDMNIFPPTPNF
ncbi:hypothetical protein J5N97_007613 [Dioscorea zingiberensis]|uniref:Uncharacterized protein n=1 Tax=Dioscorea zingiberensis TaxID=325984 RepID=A0A9D5DGJ7_9LILI|nr:hypothetical protein J5N97_007613 [Dioscorea zingiberensis]